MFIFLHTLENLIKANQAVETLLKATGNTYGMSI